MDKITVDKEMRWYSDDMVVVTTTRRHLRELPNIKAKVTRALTGTHTISYDGNWFATEDVLAENQYFGDMWYHVHKIDDEEVPELMYFLLMDHNRNLYIPVEKIDDESEPPTIPATPGVDFSPISKTVTITTERNLRDNPGLKAKVLRTLQGTHKLEITAYMKFTKAFPEQGIEAGDEWLLVETVDGVRVPPGPSNWLARVRQGRALVEFDGNGSTPLPPQKKRTHKVVSGDNLRNLARKYSTSKAKLVAANEKTYPQIAKGDVRDGWVLTIA
jgi:LysM repeat protein